VQQGREEASECGEAAGAPPTADADKTLGISPSLRHPDRKGPACILARPETAMDNGEGVSQSRVARRLLALLITHAKRGES
jgi:hypothetical protein